MYVAVPETQVQGFWVPESNVTQQFFVSAFPFPGDGLAGLPLDSRVAAPPFCEAGQRRGYILPSLVRPRAGVAAVPSVKRRG